MPEVAFGLDLDHFKVGNGGQQFRIPVDQPLVLVDEARTVKFYKNFKNRRESPSSIVKRSRDQSQEAPRRFN